MATDYFYSCACCGQRHSFSQPAATVASIFLCEDCAKEVGPEAMKKLNDFSQALHKVLTQRHG